MPNCESGAARRDLGNHPLFHMGWRWWTVGRKDQRAEERMSHLCGRERVSISVFGPSLLSPDGVLEASLGEAKAWLGLAGLTTLSSSTTLLRLLEGIKRGLPLRPPKATNDRRVGRPMMWVSHDVRTVYDSSRLNVGSRSIDVAPTQFVKKELQNVKEMIAMFF